MEYWGRTRANRVEKCPDFSGEYERTLIVVTLHACSLLSSRKIAVTRIAFYFACTSRPQPHSASFFKQSSRALLSPASCPERIDRSTSLFRFIPMRFSLASALALFSLSQSVSGATSANPDDPSRTFPLHSQPNLIRDSDLTWPDSEGQKLY